MFKRFPLLSAVLFSLVLAACGGGSSQSDTVATSSGMKYSQSLSASQSESSSGASTQSSRDAAAVSGTSGKDHGKGPSQARFNAPAGIAFDTAGNLYVADSLNYTVRKISTNGMVTTLAGTPGEQGSTDGTGAAARFFQLRGLAVDQSGNIYVADGSVVRKITPAGEVSTLAGVQGQFGNADGQGSAARFRRPTGIAVDVDRNVYVTDFFEQTIRKITPGGRVSTLAGGNSTGSTQIAFDAVGTAARFMGPNGLTIDASGNLFVTDVAGVGAALPITGSTLIRKVDRITGAVVTVAGNLGLANTPTIPTGTPVAEFEDAFGIVVDSSGNIFVADHLNGGNRIRKVTPSGEISTVAEDDSRSHFLYDLALDAKGSLFASDLRDHVIVRVTREGDFKVVAGKRGEAGSADGATGQGSLCQD